MVTLREIRSDLRALMAKDEIDGTTQQYRHQVLRKAIDDLMEYEVNEPEEIYAGRSAD